MAPKVGRKFKTKANRNIASSSSACPLVDRVRFLCDKTEEVYETLTKYRSIQGEREIVLDELDPSIRRNLMSRNWLSLCDISDPPCQVLNVQNNWQIVNTNLSRYRSQSLEVLLDNAQGDSSQDSRTYKLQEEDFIICLVQLIEEQARSIENRISSI